MSPKQVTKPLIASESAQKRSFGESLGIAYKQSSVHPASKLAYRYCTPLPDTGNRHDARNRARQRAINVAPAMTVRRWSEILNRYVALLRAVNVGGTGKLPMTVLAQMCQAVGFEEVKTYIASGNVVFRSEGREDQVRSVLQDQLRGYSGRDVGVIVRTDDEITDTLARNPFADAPGNRVMALFVDGALPVDPLEGVTGIKDEQVLLGKRELFVLYPDGMANTRLRIPGEKMGTARNMNTVAKLAEMVAALA